MKNARGFRRKISGFLIVDETKFEVMRGIYERRENGTAASVADAMVSGE